MIAQSVLFPTVRPVYSVTGTLAGNLTSFFASKAVRGRVDQVKGEQLPPALQDKHFKGKVYRLAELVVDVPSLIARLAELAGDSLRPLTATGLPTARSIGRSDAESE